MISNKLVEDLPYIPKYLKKQLADCNVSTIKDVFNFYRAANIATDVVNNLKDLEEYVKKHVDDKMVAQALGTTLLLFNFNLIKDLIYEDQLEHSREPTPSQCH